MPYDIIIGRNNSDKKLFGKRGLVYLGKGYVKMGQYTSLSNPIYMDVARSHVVLVSGKRGSGKSYSLGVIAEELSQIPEEARNIASLIFDTMGIFWTMKYENNKDKQLLSEWNLETKKLPVKIFVPYKYFEEYKNKGVPVDEPFALNVSDMKAEDWVLVFGLDIIHPVSVLIERAIYRLNESLADYDISNIILNIINDNDATKEDKNAATGLFEAASTWGIFASKGDKETRIKDLVTPGITSVLDLSVYNSVGAFNVRALVIGLVCRKLFSERMMARKEEEVDSIRYGNYSTYSSSRESPLVWIFVDEAHEFLPREGKTPASDSLIQLLREGRQPGLSLVLATQQPGEIHRDVMTQSDIVLSHRLTAQPDIEALNKIMQTYLLEGIKKSIDDLPNLKGSAIILDDILDDNSERIYPMRVRPRFTWHGGEAPSSVKPEKNFSG